MTGLLLLRRGSFINVVADIGILDLISSRTRIPSKLILYQSRNPSPHLFDQCQLFTDVSVPEYAEKHADLLNKFNVMYLANELTVQQFTLTNFIYTGAVLHVFAKDEAETFVSNVYKMLVSGGVYFGSSGVATEPTQTIVSTPKKDKKRCILLAIQNPPKMNVD